MYSEEKQFQPVRKRSVCLICTSLKMAKCNNYIFFGQFFSENWHKKVIATHRYVSKYYYTNKVEKNLNSFIFWRDRAGDISIIHWYLGPQHYVERKYIIFIMIHIILESPVLHSLAHFEPCTHYHKVNSIWKLIDSWKCRPTLAKECLVKITTRTKLLFGILCSTQASKATKNLAHPLFQLLQSQLAHTRRN